MEIQILEFVSGAQEAEGTTVIIDQQYVKDKLGHIIIDEDLSRFIL